MAAYKDHLFEGERVEICGNEFVDCTFRGCTIYFDASAAARIEGCDFHHNCHWHFGDAPLRTVQMLSLIWQMPGDNQIMRETFSLLTGGDAAAAEQMLAARPAGWAQGPQGGL